MKKVAVTGASGHIGANLVRELLGRGYKVMALVRETSAALDGLDVTRVNANILDPQSLRMAFKGVEQVYHLAAFISMQASDSEIMHSINVEGTRNVINACLSEGVSTLIHFSTVHVLDQHPMDQPVNEENSLLSAGQGGGYELSKTEAELLVREVNTASLETRIIYPSAVIGPNDVNLSMIGEAILKIAHGELPALVSGGYDWVDARDVAWGAVEAAEQGTAGDRYILSGHYKSVVQVAAGITKLTGVAKPLFTTPLWLARLFVPLMGAWARVRNETPIYTRDSLSALASNKLTSHQRATEKLGYQPRAFNVSLRDALLDYSKNGYTKVTINDH